MNQPYHSNGATDNIHPTMSLPEIFGLLPWRKRLEEVIFAVTGDEYTPASRFDLSTLKVLDARLGPMTWLGIKRKDKRVPIYNLYNHAQTPVEDGWSVRKTQVQDYRGKTLTYDSHNATDFAVPVGTLVVAPAPGLVLRVSNEFHRGGLKIFIDHGHGLVTTSNHLGRALVKPGMLVDRAQPIALAGASGLDMVAGFPWNVPHVHFNTWLNGDYVDPFARPGEMALWRNGNDPTPDTGTADISNFQPTEWDDDAVTRAIDYCLDPMLQQQLKRVENPALRAMDVLFYMNYFPTRFSSRPLIYRQRFSRQPMLDIPFSAADFIGISYRDEAW